jgi:hypothetical protein
MTYLTCSRNFGPRKNDRLPLRDRPESAGGKKVKMVREAEQSSVAAVAKKHGVSVEKPYRWRRAYGSMELPAVSSS